MDTSRLEAFSDGVLAIIITIMVLEIVPPGGHDLNDWQAVVPKLVAYVFSFLVIAIYWNNHHHLLKATKNISTGVMWANMHLLFWLSLVPVATVWVGEHENYLHQGPVAFYAFIGFMAGSAYYILTRTIIKANPSSDLLVRIGKDKKGLITEMIYLLSLIIVLFQPVISLVLIAMSALIWLIPDRRLTR